MTGGLFSDEFRFGGTPPEVRQLDLRDVVKENSYFRDTYLALHRSRESAERAAQALASLNANDKRVGETYALAGLMTTIIGEYFCSGTPFSSTLGGPSSTASHSRPTRSWTWPSARCRRAVGDRR